MMSIGQSANQHQAYLMRRIRELEDQIKVCAQALNDEERENERLAKCCTQRGARMQIMREYLVKIDEPHMDYGWKGFTADYNHPEAAAWFDANGVPNDIR